MALTFKQCQKGGYQIRKKELSDFILQLIIKTSLQRISPGCMDENQAQMCVFNE